jgi:hypothetical protein
MSFLKTEKGEGMMDVKPEGYWEAVMPLVNEKYMGLRRQGYNALQARDQLAFEYMASEEEIQKQLSEYRLGVANEGLKKKRQEARERQQEQDRLRGVDPSAEDYLNAAIKFLQEDMAPVTVDGTRLLYNRQPVTAKEMVRLANIRRARQKLPLFGEGV